MANRKTPALVQKHPTELTIPKEQLKVELEHRINIGKELHLRSIQTQQELAEVKDDFNDWDDYNLEYLKYCFNIEYNEYRKTYNGPSMAFASLDGLSSPAEQIIELKDNIKKKVKNLSQLLNKANLLKISTAVNEQVKPNQIKQELDTSKVFIVHGHDSEAETKTIRFVEKLGLEAIVLHEQASSSRTIIEKIEDYSNVGFGIVLYTACDVGAKASPDPDLQDRARQNVVFEHGFLIGKIGREKVCPIVKGNIETPNDISGVVYTQMDEGGAWQYKVANEMKAIGYNIDLNKL